MDDPVISCLAYVVKKTCITSYKLLEFLFLRILDILGLIFIILACCTIIRIPGVIQILADSTDNFCKFKWRWKFAGLWQLAVFIIDIPFYLMLPFYILCPWRIVLVVSGAQKKNEFEDFAWEGCDIRKRIWKHFILLLFDLLSIPFVICLALSWRSIRLYNLFNKCDKKEITVKTLIVTQFLFLMFDIIYLPFTLIVLVSWRSPMLFKKFSKVYIGDEYKDDANEGELKMKWKITTQIFWLLLEILSIPAMCITLFTWRLPFFILSVKRQGPQKLKYLYHWLMEKFWQNAVLFLLDIPCIIVFIILVVVSPLLPWRIYQYLSGIGARLFRVETSQNVGGEGEIITVVPCISSHKRQMNERILLFLCLLCCIMDIITMILSIIVIITLWRLPFLIYEFIIIYKDRNKPIYRRLFNSKFSEQVSVTTSIRVWGTVIMELGLLFCDLFAFISTLIIICTVWRAYPLTVAIKNAFKPKDMDKSVTFFTVNGAKIRRNIFKHLAFLLVDIPAICLCFVHLVFLIKLPAIFSTIIGGNFYMEFAITVYMETARLVVDILAFFVFISLCIFRPVAIWVHILEDDEHKKQRLSADYLVHIHWLLKQHDAIIHDTDSLLSTMIKEPSYQTMTYPDEIQESCLDDHGMSSNIDYVNVCLSSVICNYTKKLEKIRDELYENDLDDQIIYHLSKVIFFENKAGYIMGRKYQIEKSYLKTPSVIARRRNLDVFKREELSYNNRRSEALESLENYHFDKVPLWQKGIGFLQRSRKENQQALYEAVTSGNFLTLIVCILNTLLIYRAPKMYSQICQAFHLRKKIALKTLKNYGLDILMTIKIFLICLSVYKVPDLITALVVNLFQKRSVTATRKAVNAIPAQILEDLIQAIVLIFSWHSIVYAFASLLFLMAMPLSVMVNISRKLFSSYCLSYTVAGVLYLAVLVAPFVVTLILPGIIMPSEIMESVTMSYAVTGYVSLLVLMMIIFVLMRANTLGKESLIVKDIDYVRVNWFNLHVYAKLVIEFVQMISLVFSVKLLSYPYHQLHSTVSMYILLDVYDYRIRFGIACLVFVLWFFTVSIPIVLEGILKYVEKGTFTKSHFTWRAFLSFFGSTLFMVIPEVCLSLFSCDYSNCVGSTSRHCAYLMNDPSVVCWSTQHVPFATISMLMLMWYLLTSILCCLNYNDVRNIKVDLQFSPTYTVLENILKVGIVTSITLFRNNIYSLIPVIGILLVLIIITCIWKCITSNKVANSNTIIVWKIAYLVIILATAIVIFITELLQLTGNFILYGLSGFGLAVFLACITITFSGTLVQYSEQERARQKFKKTLSKLMMRIQSLDAFCYTWDGIQHPFKRMLNNVRVAHPCDKEFENPPEEGTAVLPPPPHYDDIVPLELPPDPPAYETILAEEQAKFQADDYFVPSASIYLSPFGDWQTYDAGNIVQQYGWMISSVKTERLELTDVQCNGSDMLLLLEQHIKYTAHSFSFVADLNSWREQIRKSNWVGLVQSVEELEASIDSSFDRPRLSSNSYDAKDLLAANPDTSTFPKYFELGDVTSIKMTIHQRELELLLQLIPEPWNAVFKQIIPFDTAMIHRVIVPDPDREFCFNVELFKKFSILIKDVADGGFKIAKGAKIILPKTINISNITETNLTLSKPYLSGSKGPITKHIDCLNAKVINDSWYIVVGDNKAKFSKIVATLHKLEFHS